MSLTRRSFLASILAAGVAPAVVGSGILMPVRKIITAPSMDWVDNMASTQWITYDDLLYLYPKDRGRIQIDGQEWEYEVDSADEPPMIK